jgi:mRNA-degrading endonuclease YafQ of YafQ-DinJ toxin-antitoxin module
MSQTLNNPYEFWRAKSFKNQFEKLPKKQQKAAKKTFKNIFSIDPFDSRLGTHKINRLSARYKTTVWSATIEGNLKVVFFIEGNKVWSFGIGTHAIYDQG